MNVNESVPQPSPGSPGINIPNEIPPPILPPEPGIAPEINEPPAEPSIPVREPGQSTPAQAVTM